MRELASGGGQEGLQQPSPETGSPVDMDVLQGGGKEAVVEFVRFAIENPGLGAEDAYISYFMSHAGPGMGSMHPLERLMLFAATDKEKGGLGFDPDNVIDP